ncbi:hypothetical protein Egran_06188 [Elaphomyces granulatus]|uniref:C-CAP/cofactor C-like domain-containing protein n=1 Tax=Elaphomyces granulatus TaxID=519963 RepID=A0A232LPF7_9EURO|nr:hypothetical protein Egran_06188 [Elaphomyces granulatus]
MSQPVWPPPTDSHQVSKSDISLKEQFFRYFQNEITVVQEQMNRLADTSLVGGERSDATDHCLAGIARLSNEVKDASSYIPTYDQRIYAEAIKALQDKLAETRAAVAPRTKFSFKTRKKSCDAAAQGRQHIPGSRFPDASSRESSLNPTPNYASVNEAEQVQLRPETALNSAPAPFDSGKEAAGSTEETSMRQPTFSKAFSVAVSSHHGLYIMLPMSTSHSTVPASITSLRHCVVDTPGHTANGNLTYASLTIKGVKESLLICGQVEGPAHVTGVEHSVVVVACRQFRMHNCTDVDVYLSCCSHPIIEDCKGVRFGRLPKVYALEQNWTEFPDCWDKVEDFKWIKPEPSPNWCLLDENNTVPEAVWAEMIPGGPSWSVEDILRATKVLKD